jgi:hypothetical protein
MAWRAPIPRSRLPASVEFINKASMCVGAGAAGPPMGRGDGAAAAAAAGSGPGEGRGFRRGGTGPAAAASRRDPFGPRRPDPWCSGPESGGGLRHDRAGRLPWWRPIRPQASWTPACPPEPGRVRPFRPTRPLWQRLGFPGPPMTYVWAGGGGDAASGIL